MPIRWDLDSLYYGLDINRLEKHIKDLLERLVAIEFDSYSKILGSHELMIISEIITEIESIESFYYCLTTEEVEASSLRSLDTNISTVKTKVRQILLDVRKSLRNLSEEQYENWSHITNNRFVSELVKGGINESNAEREISSFSKETLSSFEDMYIQLRDQIKVKAYFNHLHTELSFAEASRLAMSHTELPEKENIFKELNESVALQANIFASIYNQMVGLRLTLYKMKSIDYLDETLKVNGISKEALDMMWGTVDNYREDFTTYLTIRAKELDKQRLSWHEYTSSSEEVTYKITFKEAVDLLSDALENIDSNMVEFVKEAISKKWVDAEQRQSKSPGGFCAPFISKRESRISLSYDNSIDSARRLAHELGHAWHFRQMKNKPSLLFSDETFEMTMAETSSIFFETLFINHLIHHTKDITLKTAILESKLKRSLNYLTSIRAAFLFENDFYECRKIGSLNLEKIEKLSLVSQEKAYSYALREYEPFMWLKYVQFYQASTPFYNYPYTFGFLLSTGLLEMAKTDERFPLKFQSFLSDTGTIPLELLIKKHFHIDLTQPTFWQNSLAQLKIDIESYKKYKT